jgi:UvrD-like helicase family protein
VARERSDDDPDQRELIRMPADRLLVVQGGPGTGKTRVALHRVAWLIAAGEVPAGEVLIVGPSPAFTRFSRAAMPSWGADGVDHRAVTRLHPPVDDLREETPYLQKLKGDARMAGLLSRALKERPDPVPTDLPATLTVAGQPLAFDPERLRRVVITAHASQATPGDRRRILRGMLASDGADPGLILPGAEALAERIWPALSPVALLTGLFASPEWLTAAAGFDFTQRELTAMRTEPGAKLGPADLPLLDEADHLLEGEAKRYAHIVLDGAPDFSPMQLRAVSRRASTGSMTVVGDLAQSTGPWARDDWNDVLAHLPQTMPQILRTLTHGYRVPGRIFELAAELLPAAAPSAQAPTSVADGPAEPVVEPVTDADRATVVVAAATQHAARGRTVAIICPDRCRDEIETGLRDGDILWDTEPGHSITLLGPHEAKGLEFDAVVVVEPGDIVDDDPRGHRLLYIALTRAARHLHLIGAAADLPLEFAAPDNPIEDQDQEQEPEYAPAVREAIDTLAHTFAEALLANLTPPLWGAVLRRLERLIAPFDPLG